MTIPIKDGQIIKQDSMGRKRITKEQREALLAEYDQSGMTCAAFTRWAGIPYGTFITWVHKRRRQAGNPAVAGKKEGQAAVVEWVEAVVEKSPEEPVKKPDLRKESALKVGTALVVEGPGGIRMELNEERHVLWTAKLLRHMGGIC